MTPLLDELVAVLVAETAQVRRLLPILRDEERALLAADSSRVAELAGEKEHVAHELAALDRTRRMLVDHLAHSAGIRPEVVTLSALLRLSPAPPAALTSLRRELRDLLTSVQALNRRNGFLAERSLGFVRGLLSELLSVVTPPATYAPTGRSDRAAPALQFLDRRA